MSLATPMPSSRRLAAYLAQTVGRTLTARQRRRLIKKRVAERKRAELARGRGADV